MTVGQLLCCLRSAAALLLNNVNVVVLICLLYCCTCGAVYADLQAISMQLLYMWCCAAYAWAVLYLYMHMW